MWDFFVVDATGKQRVDEALERAERTRRECEARSYQEIPRWWQSLARILKRSLSNVLRAVRGSRAATVQDTSQLRESAAPRQNVLLQECC